MVSFYQESKHLPKYLQLISVFISLPWWVSFRKRLAGALSTRTQEYDLNNVLLLSSYLEDRKCRGRKEG